MYRAHLLETFRSLDAALDEHKAKGTKPLNPVYAKIFEQLAEDVAVTGFGRDDIAQAGYQVGQLSTYKRLESLMPKQLEPYEQEAIGHLENQISELTAIRANAEQAHANSAAFIGWKSHTTDLLAHYIPSSSEVFRKFSGLSFRSNVMTTDYPGARIHRGPGRDDLEKFAADADIATACLQRAIKNVQTFRITKDEPAPVKAARSREPRSLTQVFTGPVNQAIAMDRANQSVGHVGPSGNTIAEILDLIQQSYELTRREMEDAIRAAKQIDTEVTKPETSRNWKSIAEWGNTLLGIAGKATDLTEKLAPHLPWIASLIEQATRHG